LKNGDEIKAIVQEVGIDDVKYKKYENPSGPTYTLLKSDIFMIKYENGEKDIFVEKKAPEITNAAPFATANGNHGAGTLTVHGSMWSRFYVEKDGVELNPNGVRQLLSSNPQSLDKLNTSKNKEIWSYVLSGLGGAQLGVAILGFIDMATSEGEYSTIGIGTGTTVFFLITGTSTVVGAFYMLAASLNDYKTAVNLYNAGIMGQSPAYSLNFGLTRSGGVGFTLTF
jgi:hypothetical protein